MLSSRLDRLLTLLSSSSSSTRSVAARQIGLIASARNGQIPTLLSLLHPLLRSSKWESRLAAVEALEQVCRSAEGVVNLKNEVCCKEEKTSTKEEEDQTFTTDACFNDNVPKKDSDENNCLSIDSFDVEAVLKEQGRLEASKGHEFNAPIKPDLEQQRQELNKKLGLDVVVGKAGVSSSTSLVTDDDLEIKIPTTTTANSMTTEVITTTTPASNGVPLVREKNRTKRSLSKATKDSQRKRIKAANSVDEGGPSYKAPSINPEKNSDVFVCLKDFCDCLLRDLSHSSWEIRHGAATALQAVIRFHGEKLGSRRWLESVAMHLLRLMSKDRVNDFVSDHVVAPVRESAAQAFVTTIVLLETQKIDDVTPILLKLMDQNDWQCKHGALLAMKYLLAVNSALVSSLSGPIFECMQISEEEDVVAVAAQALLPVVPNLFDCDQVAVPKLMEHLWNVLQSLDELANSTQSVMSLLAEVISHQSLRDAGALSNVSGGLVARVPRLLPYLSHPSTPTRKSALSTLMTITSRMAVAEQFLPFLAKPICCHLFQRAILEHNKENLVLIERIWNCVCDFTPLGPLLLACCPLYGSWVTMIAQPPTFPIPPHLLICSKSSNGPQSPLYIGGPETQHNTNLYEKDRAMTRARCLAAKMLGKLAGFIVQPVPGMDYSKDQLTPMEMFVQKILLPNLTPKSAYQRSCISLVIVEWCHQHEVKDVPQLLNQTLFQLLTEPEQGFDESIQSTAVFQSEATDFISTLKHYKLALPEDMLQQELSTVLTFERTKHFLQTADLDTLLRSSKVKSKLECSLKERRENLVNSLNQIAKEHAFLNTLVTANVASAVVALGANNLCGKLNPVLKPLMEAIKREQNEELQTRAAVSLADLMVSCSTLTPLATQKVIKNLVSFACVDSNITPVFDPEANSENNSQIQMLKLKFFIDSHTKLYCSSSNANNVGDGQELAFEVNASPSMQERIANCQSRGATIALKTLTARLPVKPFEQLPTLEEMTIGAVKNASERSPADLVYCLRALEIIVPCLPGSVHASLNSILQPLSDLLRCVYSSIRHMSSRCFAQLALLLPVATMSHVVLNIVPQLLDSTFVQVRQGGIECLACIVQNMELDVVPYIVFLLLPVMARMSDVNEQVRLLATNVFATFIKLMPLEGAVELPSELPHELQSVREKERKFLDQLLRGVKLDDVHLPFQISVKLRDYQKEGISWLSFLRNYQLHGILCDDMGLGKTLQTICVLALHHKEVQERRITEFPSIVVCPQTLCNHWYNEIMAHIGDDDSGCRFLRPLVYTGSTQTRNEIRQQFHAHNLLISSYDVIRNDLELLSSQQWNYVVLDEGHVIKNGKTKTTQAIKKLRANYRLVLTGTPIQNTVLELWSIFDFLMPGYLGTERDFNARFARPIGNSRDPKCSSRAKERGALAMEALHKQVLPFILRRLKDDVLKDLPEKITQDYYCDLSAVQVKLYDDYTSKRHKNDDLMTFNGDKSKDEEEHLANGGGVKTENSKGHVFKALQYLRKVCNHPKLVVDRDHPEYPNVMKFLRASNSSLDDISHAAKLPALRDLLLQCGIGANYSESANIADGGDVAPVVQHRALIFCQLKSMIDIVERDLLKNRMPNVTYLRLDGSVPPNQRQSIVDKFNNDSSIDVLLLSTSVGGMGLNLTGADTVIFVEHDWNPMKDLQAMDRAHRLGQKRAVNVYRLITRNTLEEKIMSLQWFKIKTAKTVISADNASLQSMGTEKVFDLFALDDERIGTSTVDAKRSKLSKRQGLQAIVDELPELWDDSQYEEFDVEKFVRKHSDSNATSTSTTHSKSTSNGNGFP